MKLTFFCRFRIEEIVGTDIATKLKNGTLNLNGMEGNKVKMSPYGSQECQTVNGGCNRTVTEAVIDATEEKGCFYSDKCAMTENTKFISFNT